MRKSRKVPPGKVHWFDMGPWPFHCALATGPKAFAREMKRLKVDGPPFQATPQAMATAHWIVREGKAAIGMIAMAPDPGGSKVLEAARVAHEALHLVQALRCHINAGEPLDDESEAYLVQYITGRCLGVLWGTGLVPAVQAG